MIIGISGKARSGKDTFAEMLASKLNQGAHPPYVLMAFANELKLRCQKDFDLTWEQLWGEHKELPDKRFYKHESEISDYWTAREIMQEYGAFFRRFNKEFWIENLFKVAKEKGYNNVIITDVRYINEADYIQRKGYVIRVERENKDDVHNMQHPSEIELDNYKGFDYVVLNNWSLKELEEAAKDVARYLRQSEKDLKDLSVGTLLKEKR